MSRDTDALETVAACGFIAVGATVLMTVDIVLMGWAVMNLWNWFIPAALPGTPFLTWAHAVGLRVVWNALNRSLPQEKRGTQTEDQSRHHMINVLLYVFLSPFLLVAIGAIIKAFIF